MSSEVVIRPACLSDYSAVVDGIGDVYYGRDYLPDIFEEFVKDPVYLPYVAEVEGEVVGFFCAHLLDGGRTLDKRAGRVKPSHQGLGVFTKLSDHIEAEAKRRSSLLTQEVMSVGTRNIHRVRKGYNEEKGYKLLMEWDFYVNPVQKGSTTSPEPSSFKEVKEMNPADLENLMNDPVIWSKVVPHKRLYSDFVAFGRHKENIPYLISRKSAAFMSTGVMSKGQGQDKPSSTNKNQGQDMSAATNEGQSGDTVPEMEEVYLKSSSDSEKRLEQPKNKISVASKSESPSGLNQSSTTSNINNISLLSTSDFFPSQIGLTYNTEFYGYDFTDFESHVRCHLFHLLDKAGERDVSWGILLDLETAPVLTERLRACLAGFGITLTRNERVVNLYGFERDL